MNGPERIVIDGEEYVRSDKYEIAVKLATELMAMNTGNARTLAQEFLGTPLTVKGDVLRFGDVEQRIFDPRTVGALGASVTTETTVCIGPDPDTLETDIRTMDASSKMRSVLLRLLERTK